MTGFSCNYIKLKKQSLIITIILVAFLLLTMVKFFTIYNKVKFFNEAEMYYNKGQLVLAEEYYQKSSSIGFFNYKNQHLEDRFNTLFYVTETKREIKQLKEKVLQSLSNKEILMLLDSYKVYNSMKSESLKETEKVKHEVFAEAAKFYDIEGHLGKAFEEFKGSFIKSMNSEVKSNSYKKGDSLKEGLLSIPDLYYGGKDKKHAQIQDSFKKYDEAKLNYLKTHDKFENILIQANGISEENGINKIDNEWLQNWLDAYSTDIFTYDRDSKDYKAFAAHAIAYEKSTTDISKKYKTKIENLIQEYLSLFLKEANTFIDNKDFEKAIGIYEALNPYKDNSSMIQSAQIAWIEENPSKILMDNDGTMNYENPSIVKDKWGSKISIAASTKENELSKIVIGRMLQDSTIKILSKEVFKDGTSIKTIEMNENLDKNNPIIIVQGDSSSRNSKYVLYEILGDDIKEILRTEADSIIVEDDGMIQVNNPVGDLQNKACYYIVREGHYILGYIGVDNTEALKEYQDGRYEYGLKLRCNIIYVNDIGAVARLSGDEGLYEGFDKCIILKGGSSLHTGQATVTGNYRGYENLMIDGVYLLQLPAIEAARLNYIN